MDDSEARYLIDQFNKFSSWSLKGVEPTYSLAALTFSIMAILVVLINTLNSIIRVPEGFIIPIYFFIAFSLLFLLVYLMHATRVIVMEHERNLSKLILLETYRSENKLPDSLTFDIIVNRTPQQLEKLLQTTKIKM